MHSALPNGGWLGSLERILLLWETVTPCSFPRLGRNNTVADTVSCRDEWNVYSKGAQENPNYEILHSDRDQDMTARRTAARLWCRPGTYSTVQNRIFLRFRPTRMFLVQQTDGVDELS
jgi:hypothetical protein